MVNRPIKNPERIVRSRADRESRVRDKSLRCITTFLGSGSRLNDGKVEAADAVHQPSNYMVYTGLVHKGFLVSCNSLAEHVVGPALISEHDGHEDERHD